MGLKQERARIYLDMKGRIACNRKIFTMNANKGIIKEKKMYRKKLYNMIEPMPKRQLQKIIKAFKRQGGIIQMNDETDAFLNQKMRKQSHIMPKLFYYIKDQAELRYLKNLFMRHSFENEKMMVN